MVIPRATYFEVSAKFQNCQGSRSLLPSHKHRVWKQRWRKERIIIRERRMGKRERERIFYIVVLGIKTRSLHMLNKHPPTEP